MMTRVRKLAQLCNSRDPTVQTRLTQVLYLLLEIKSVQRRNQEAEFFYSLWMEHRKTSRVRCPFFHFGTLQDSTQEF
jgi:hypothetical protein